MKKILVIIILSAINYVNGQDCNMYSYFKKGAEFEMTSFDGKDKVIAKSKSKVLNVTTAGGSTEAEISVSSANAKGKEQFSANSTIKCSEGGISLSMKNMMNPEQMAGMKDMEIKIDETFLDYPNNMAVGSNLKDGTFKAEMFTGGMRIMTINITVADRKVIAKEDITTPAGTINCYKITYKGGMKAMISMSYNVNEWYSPKYGVVKTETTRNGKSMGYSLLTFSNVN